MHDKALAAYHIALSLLPSTPDALLTKWVGTMLLDGSTRETIDSAKEVCITQRSILSR